MEWKFYECSEPLWYTAQFELQVKQTPQRKASSTASAEVKRVKIRAFLVGGSSGQAGKVDAELAVLITISAFAELAAPELITDMLAAASISASRSLYN